MQAIIDQAVIKVEKIYSQVTEPSIFTADGQIEDPGAQIEATIKMGGPTFASIFDKGPR